jgi:two-component system response regulator YesN
MKTLKNWIDYVNKHLSDQELSLKKIANEELFVNVGYLSRLFNKEMNESFPHYVTRMRICLAQKLIDNSQDDRIYEIAEKTGFGDNPQYFSQIFKNHTNYTPTEYRLRNKR